MSHSSLHQFLDELVFLSALFCLNDQLNLLHNFKEENVATYRI